MWKVGTLFNSSANMHWGLQGFHLPKWIARMMEAGWGESGEQGRVHVMARGVSEKGLFQGKKWHATIRKCHQCLDFRGRVVRNELTTSQQFLGALRAILMSVNLILTPLWAIGAKPSASFWNGGAKVRWRFSGHCFSLGICHKHTFGTMDICSGMRWTHGPNFDLNVMVQEKQHIPAPKGRLIRGEVASPP